MDWDESMQPDGQAVISAAYSIGMLGVLPRYAASDGDTSVPDEVSHACLESFYMHVRLLVEYFLPPPSGRQDGRNHYVTDFAPGWAHPTDDSRTRLLGAHQDASKFVAHITKDRTDITNVQVRARDVAALKAVAEDVFAVVERFCDGNEADHEGKVRFLRTEVGMARSQA